MDETQIYQDGLDRYGESPLALHWVDYRSMAIRFKNLIKDIDIEGKTVLDAGCGMGDLLPYLYTKADDFSYLGVDINPGFIEIAKKRYEGHRFETGNPFDGHYRHKFDIVISSGVMNIRVKNWQKLRKLMIKNLFNLSHEALAFNMAGGLRGETQDSLIAYADARDIFSFCEKLSRRSVLRTNYLSNDFTVTLFK